MEKTGRANSCNAVGIYQPSPTDASSRHGAVNTKDGRFLMYHTYVFSEKDLESILDGDRNSFRGSHSLLVALVISHSGFIPSVE